MFRRLWSRRDLLCSLVRKQYQVRYRQSFGGILWKIITPLATLGLGTIVFKRLAGLDTGETPYAVVTLAALTPWSFFASSLTSGVMSVAQSQSMVQRLAFPRAVLPLSLVGVSLLDLAYSGLIFLIFAFTVGEGLPATAMWFPVLLLIEVVLVSGAVLLTSALNVFIRDVKVILPFMVQFLLFLTPVMYPLSSVPETLRPWYLANPMTGLVESFRGILVSPGHPPDLGLLLPAIVGAIAIFTIGWWYFAATEIRFADVI